MANNDGFYSILDDVFYDEMVEQTKIDRVDIANCIKFLIGKGIIQELNMPDKKKVIYDITLYENALRVMKKYKWKATKNINHLITAISNDIEKEITNIYD